jgi:radical SAM superfamily enzyme YgiQ (UPF0313 family)
MHSFDDTYNKDQKLLDALMPYAKKTARKNLSEVQINYAVRKTSICFALLPEWAPKMPPFAIARLAAITKNAGYKTTAFDVNIEAWNDSKNWGLDFYPWHDVYWSRWTDESQFNLYMKAPLTPILDKFIKNVFDLKPTVLGFTMYDCNKLSIEYVIKELKKLLPDLIIMLGGPSCNRGLDLSRFSKLYTPDYIICGEGEELILQALEEIESGYRPESPKLLIQEFTQRIDLDNIPAPDYSYFDNDLYEMPNGALMEFSRGCIAKCVFCDETHFWKYRDRRALNAVTELKNLYDTKGVNAIFFVDSLVNGNLKELRAFAKGVVAANMKISWTGWMRCDGRMDNEYIKDLAASGLKSMAYGVESGSNKVLADMNKQITREEVEQNFKDGAEYGIKSNAMIILGFPTEFYNDVYDSMVLIYRIKNYNLGYVLCGLGMYIGDENIIGRNRAKYNVSYLEFENSWILNNFTNSKVHRLIRIKSFNVFLDTTRAYPRKSKWPQIRIFKNNNTLCHRPNTKNDYTFTPKSNREREIEYELFDFNICKPNISPFADSLVNEVWPLLRLLWRTRGDYSLNLLFDSERDTLEYGPHASNMNFNAVINFTIDSNGSWEADFNFNYKQPENTWKYHYVSEIKTNAVRRIEILSDDSLFKRNLNPEVIKEMEEEYNKEYDFSFSYQYKGNGKWN